MFKECDGSSFGPNCSEICNCAENGDCDHVNGSCPNGCAEGWGGSSCSLGTVHCFTVNINVATYKLM